MADDTERQANEPRRTAAIERLLGFATLLEGFSRRFLGTARHLTLLGLFGGLVVDLLLRRAFDWSSGVTIGVGVIFLMPAAVVGWGWYVLSEAAGLPARLLSWLGSAQNYAGMVAGRVIGNAAPSKGRLADLFALGGLAVELTSMGLDASGLMAILGGTLSVTNPIYLVALGVSVLLIGILALLAVILGLSALF